jgi:hypothetical protein
MAICCVRVKKNSPPVMNILIEDSASARISRMRQLITKTEPKNTSPKTACDISQATIESSPLSTSRHTPMSISGKQFIDSAPVSVSH